VDVYDFHWYAEVYDASGTRILNLNGTNLTDAQIQLIVQSPRNLWDLTFNQSTTTVAQSMPMEDMADSCFSEAGFTLALRPAPEPSSPQAGPAYCRAASFRPMR
jgi:hypothetical protein